jgi:surface protein
MSVARVVVAKASGFALTGGEAASSSNVYDWLEVEQDTTRSGNGTTSTQYSARVSFVKKAAVGWGDGQSYEVNSATESALTQLHTYASPGTYSVRYLLKQYPGQTSALTLQYAAAQTSSAKHTDVKRWGGANLDYKGVVAYFSGSAVTTLTATDLPPSVCNSWISAFNSASAFAGSNLANWTHIVFEKTEGMFRNTIFNEDISGWDMTTNEFDLDNMFAGDEAFNRDISSWSFPTPTGTKTMEAVFSEADAFNDPLASWNTSKTTTFYRCFYRCDIFNQDLGSWDVSSATILTGMFQDTPAFNNGGVSTVGTGLDTWNVTNVVSFNSMFRSASAFNSYLGSWTLTTDPAKDINMDLMFLGCGALNQDFSGWNTVRVSTMALLFQSCSSFNNDGVGGTGVGLDSWTLTNVSSLQDMFKSATSFNQELGSWSFRPAGVTMHGMFESTSSFVGTGLGNWDVSMVNDFSDFAYGATALNFPITHSNYWEISPGVNCTNIFRDCTNLNGGQAPGASGRNFELKFSTAPGDTYALNNFFQGSDRFNQDISTDAVNGYWEMDNVTTLSSFLYQATDFNQDVSNWNVGNCTDFNFCFGSTSFNHSLSAWNVSSATDMSGMFFNSSFDSPLTWGVKTSLVEDMSQMFQLTPFDQDISGWSIASLSNASNMFFNNSAWSTTNYDLLLDSTTGWASQATIQSGVTFSAGSTQYTSGGNAEAGRNILTGTYGWTILRLSDGSS